MARRAQGPGIAETVRHGHVRMLQEHVAMMDGMKSDDPHKGMDMPK
jgi:hypothetical protein